jgi:hypothetical protein
VDERTCQVEDEECPNPREEQNQRQDKKYKPHQQTPLWPAIISLFGKPVCSRGPKATFREEIISNWDFRQEHQLSLLRPSESLEA